MIPKRIQRKRTKGWRMPANAVYVGRGSRWGNPYRVSSRITQQEAVDMFIDFINRAPLGEDEETVQELIQHNLKGRDLACWCSLDVPCHADVLLDIANRDRSSN